MDEQTESAGRGGIVNALTLLGGMLLLGAVLMGIIYGVAALFDSDRPGDAPRPLTAVEAARQDSQRKNDTNARTRVAVPYTPENWPTYPGRSTGGHVAAANAAAAARSGSGETGAGGGGAAAPAAPPVPVGITADEYRAEVSAGKKVFLPDPKGECNLTVAGSAAATSGIQDCFAARAAKPAGG